jgi:hypothetical protein
MVIEMVQSSVFWLNMFPPTDGASDSLSPTGLIVGLKLDYGKHCQLEFGFYVQTHEEHDNSMGARTTGAIALRPTGNAQGRYYFLSLLSGQRLTRNRWTDLPMPQDVIDRVHVLAWRSKADRDLTFAWRDGTIITDDDDNDNDDDSDWEPDSEDDNSNWEPDSENESVSSVDDDDNDAEHHIDDNDLPLAGVDDAYDNAETEDNNENKIENEIENETQENEEENGQDEKNYITQENEDEIETIDEGEPDIEGHKTTGVDETTGVGETAGVDDNPPTVETVDEDMDVRYGGKDRTSQPSPTTKTEREIPEGHTTPGPQQATCHP